jgi:ABC-2 type transport system permease protein
MAVGPARPATFPETTVTTVEAARPLAPRSRLVRLWTSRRTLVLLVTRDLKVKYSGSALGYVWSVLEPLMLAGVYWFVFTQLVIRSVGEQPYIVFLLCAILPWQWFNASVRGSMRALSRDAKLVRSTNLPREIWVMRTVASRFMEFVYSLPVLAFFAIVSGAKPSWHVVFFPVAMLIQFVLLLGLGLTVAPVAVLYSDVERLWRVALRLLFYFSPIIFGIQDINQRLGETAAKFFALNPLAGIFDLYRMAFFADQWAGWAPLAVSVVAALVSMAIGLSVFRRLEGTVLKEI